MILHLKDKNNGIIPALGAIDLQKKIKSYIPNYPRFRYLAFMRVSQLILTILVLLLTQNLLAQKTTFSGYVQDAKTKEKLLGATVYISSLHVGTHTNNYGFYSLTIPSSKEKFILKASYIGYDIDSVEISAGKNDEHTFNLVAHKELKEVTIRSKRSEKIQESTQMSKIDLPISTIKKLPAFLGEVDVLKAIQLLPGIQAGTEGQSGIYVRGGGPDQNLILLDGIPVYNASHLFGFFSVFNADAVSSVEVYKGGFPARYGGRLSSVIDIRMKEGDKSGLHGSIGLGLISSRGMLEGPLGKKKERGSWMVSGRRTYIDALIAPLVLAASNGQGTGGYYFYDMNAKMNYKLGKKDRLYASAYLGNDKFYIRAYDNGSESLKANIKWGNVTALLRWNHQFNAKVFGNLSATYSRYRFGILTKIGSTDISGKTSTFSALYASSIQDVSLKYDVDWIPSPKHYVKTGVSAIYHTFTPGAVTLKNSDFPESNLDTTFNLSQTPELDAYIEDDIEITKNLKANLGMHFSGFITSSNFYRALQPRASVRYLITKTMSAKASYSQMAQYIHLLTNNGIGLPTDLWVPVTDKVKPQLSHQVAAGLARTLNESYEVSIEGYYKTMQNIIEYKDGSSFLNTNQSWEDKVEMGKGWSYGGEFFVQKKTGRLTGMMGYTLSWTQRQFPTINEGKVFPYKYDRRHDFKIAAVYKWKKSIELSGEWVYGTGNAVSMPLFRFNTTIDALNMMFGGNDNFYYGSRNQYRMKAYHRFDLGINFIKELRKGRERTWNFSIYNAYSRKNPFFIYSEYNSKLNKYEFQQFSLFPILPAFSYNLKF